MPVDIEGAGINSAFERLLALVQGQTAAHQKTPPPEGLKATLRPYQEAGFAWLAEMRRLGFGRALRTTWA